MVTIQKACVEDAVKLTEVQISAFKDEVKKYGGGPSGYDSVDAQVKLVTEKIYYKVLYNGEIAGGIVVFDQGSQHYHLYRLYIDACFQNRGIGQGVIKLVESEFPNGKRWTLDTPHLSFMNHHFYEKMGYKKVGETEPDKNSGFCLFLYEKVIELAG